MNDIINRAGKNFRYVIIEHRKFWRTNMKHDYYVGTPGHFNIWYIKNGKLTLLENSAGFPWEFESEEFANKYGKENIVSEEKFGTQDFVARSVPEVIHDFSFIRKSPEEVRDFLNRNNVEEEECRDIFSSILTAEDGQTQALIWLYALKDQSTKAKIHKYKATEEIEKMVNNLFLGNSVHTIMAKLAMGTYQTLKK